MSCLGRRFKLCVMAVDGSLLSGGARGFDSHAPCVCKDKDTGPEGGSGSLRVWWMRLTWHA